jgi:hypothetical protein
MMQRWLEEERKIEKAYEDQSLIQQGLAEGWSTDWYNKRVYDLYNPGAKLEPTQDAQAVMNTVWDDDHGNHCVLQNYGPGCTWLLSKGLPLQACQIAFDHEATHVAQCQADQAAGFPRGRHDIRVFSEREIDAHFKQLGEISQWIAANCGP